VPQGWIDPNDKAQKQYLPHIGERVLFKHDGRVYLGKHTGGSFKAEYPFGKTFGTWDCKWMYPSALDAAAPQPPEGLKREIPQQNQRQRLWSCRSLLPTNGCQLITFAYQVGQLAGPIGTSSTPSSKCASYSLITAYRSKAHEPQSPPARRQARPLERPARRTRQPAPLSRGFFMSYHHEHNSAPN